MTPEQREEVVNPALALLRTAEQPAQPQGEREAFEADAETRYPGINLRASRTTKGYINPGWHDDWLVWRRAWSAALSASTPPAEAVMQQSDTEQAAFENWLSHTCPSGDAEAVQRQWLASRDYAGLSAVSAEARGAARLTDDEFISALDSRGIAVDPELAFAIKEILDCAAMGTPPADNKEQA